MSAQRQPSQDDSPAVAIARAHVEAWSNHDWDKARRALAEDVKVIATTTQPIMKEDTNTTGADAYMRGLKEFAEGVDPGSARVISSVGDDRNALLVVSVKAALGPGPKMTVTAARLYLLDEKDKIKSERFIFYAAPRRLPGEG
jgi:SnoaL-like domain